MNRARPRRSAIACAIALAACTERAPVPDAAAPLAPPPPPPPEPARPGPPLPVEPLVNEKLDQLAFSVGLQDLDLEIPCVEKTAGVCVRRALDRVFHRLDRPKSVELPVRLVLLGDSHIAADYIAKTARTRLQGVFGDAGRGYIHADQREGYGGRRLGGGASFVRRRMIDPGLGRGRYGISGHALVAQKIGATLEYALEGDASVTLYLDAHPAGADLLVKAEDNHLGIATGIADPATTLAAQLAVPPGAKVLKLSAAGAGATLLGLEPRSGKPGLLLDAIGPVGADATTYVEADAASFESHVRAMEPALLMLMLGGNDALRIRKGQATLEETRARFDLLLERFSLGAPGADCLVWGPMDAGDRVGEKVVSKSGISEIRDLLRELAAAHGCAFWDLYAVMGGKGSITRWSKAGIMNADLIHPRAKSGELLGYFFAEAFLRAYAEVR